MSVDPYGTIRAQVLDLQGNATGGAVSNNDWRLVVDNESLIFQHYDATANNNAGAYITRQSFGTGLTGISVVPLGTYSITGNLQVTDDLTVDGGTLFVDSSTNRVGFGTVTPSQVVHVVGNTYVDGDLTVTGTASISSSSVWTKDGATNEITYTVANVGIGTSNPDSALHVNGTSKFVGNMTLTGDVSLTGHIVPATANTYDLGSATNTFRHVYVGPGSLYVNGKQVITDDSDTITISTSINQNLALKTSGSGNLQISSSGSGDIELTAGGIVQIKKTLQILDGQKITSSGGTTVVCGNNFQSEGSLRGATLTLDGSTSIGPSQINVLADATIGTGVAFKAVILDTNKDFSGIRNLSVTGDLTILGTTTTINSTTVSVADGMFKYASNNASNAIDMGWYGKYVDSSVTYYAGMFRDATDNKMRFFTSTQVEPATTVDTGGTGYAKADVVVGDIDFTSGTMRGSIIPDTTNAYDIGSSEFKIRDMYVSDNSLWVGDNHKISIDSNGKMKFRKRKTTSVPAAIVAASGLSAAAAETAAVANTAGVTAIADMKLKDWRAYMRTLSGKATATVSEIFRSTSDDYEQETGADAWLDNGNDVYLGASGNVGIGIASPNYKLVVNGDINFTGTLYQNGSAFSSGSSFSKITETIPGTYGSISTTGSGGSGNVSWEGYSINGRYVFMSQNDDQCGIYNDIDNKWIWLYNRTNSTSGNLQITCGVVGDPQMTIFSTGNVAIGDQTNTYKLHVAGDINFTGDIRKNGVVQSFGGSSVWSESNNVASYGDNTNGTICIKSSDSVDKIQLTKEGTLGSKINHAGGWKIQYKAGPGNNAGATGAHSFYTTQSSAYQERMSIISNGNVGIGNTAPSYKLDVTGNARITTDLNVLGNLTVGGTTTTINTATLNVEDTMIKLATNNTGTSVDIGFYGKYGSTATYSGLIRKAAGGWELGNFGTTEPTATTATSSSFAKLSVSQLLATADLTVGSASAVQGSFQGTNTTYNGSGFVQAPWIYTAGIENITEKGSAGTGMFFGTSATASGNDVITFVTNGSNRLAIDSAGVFNYQGNKIVNASNVGIGTDNPDAKLHISGSVTNTTAFSVASPLLRLTQTNGDTPWDWASIVLETGGYKHTIGMSLNTFQIKAKGDANFGNIEFIVGDGTTTAMTIGNTGLVNIATLALGDVGHGTGWPGIANSTSASSTGYAVIQNVNGETLVNCQSGQKIGFREANGEKMTIKGGNVGIGNINPSKKLEVNGSFSASGSSGFTGMVCSFVGEISNDAAEGTRYRYGNGADAGRGIAMVKAGKVIGMSVSFQNATTCVIGLYNNNNNAAQYLTCGIPAGGSSQGSWNATTVTSKVGTFNYSFNAGDCLAMRVYDRHAHTIDDSVAIFWVKYT
jgi:hypothetical protein